MVWCADHGTYAQEICETIYESLTIDETPLHKKIARVYLICDILANCAQRGVRDIFFYRTCFEQLMTKIFEALGDTLRNIEARLKAEHFKQRIMLCFRAWEDNAIYPTEFLIHNQNVFLGLVKRSDEHFQSESENGGDDEDIDGAPIDDDIDGVPLSEDMLEPTTTLFGSKIVDPVISQHEKKGGFKSAGWNDVTEEVKKPTSKWENDGRDSDEERAGTAKRFKMDGKAADKPGSSSDSEGEIQETDPNAAQAAAHYEEVRRRMLREVEVKVMSYQDDLESARDPDIKNKVEEFRKKEMNVMELKLRSARSKDEDRKKNEKRRDRRDDKHSSSSGRRDRSRDKDRKRERSRSRFEALLVL
ncbi:unnamed protein product [Auanema sp. JU1783]|nr:unnamed protein product [Auanema sp. JU1783]